MRIPSPQFLHPCYGVVLDATLKEMFDIRQTWFVRVYVRKVPSLSRMELLLRLANILGPALFTSHTIDYIVRLARDVLFYMECCGRLCNVDAGVEFTVLTRVAAFISTFMKSNRSILSWWFLLVNQGYMDQLPSSCVKHASTMFTSASVPIANDVLWWWYDFGVVR